MKNTFTITFALMLIFSSANVALAESKAYSKAKLKFFNNSSITSYVSTSGSSDCSVESESTCSSNGSSYTCASGDYLYISGGSDCPGPTPSCVMTIYSDASLGAAYELGQYEVSSSWSYINNPSTTVLSENGLTISTDQSKGDIHCVVSEHYPVYEVTLSND